MGLFDTVTVDVLSADFQTKQLGEGMLRYRLGEDGRLMAPAAPWWPTMVWSTSTARTALSLSPCSPTAPRIPGPHRRRDGRRLPLPGVRVALDAGFLVT
jgi:hypothetical protein